MTLIIKIITLETIASLYKRQCPFPLEMSRIRMFCAILPYIQKCDQSFCQFDCFSDVGQTWRFRQKPVVRAQKPSAGVLTSTQYKYSTIYRIYMSHCSINRTFPFCGVLPSVLCFDIFTSMAIFSFYLQGKTQLQMFQKDEYG